MAGSFGYELDLNLLTEEEKEQVRAQLVYAGEGKLSEAGACFGPMSETKKS